MNSLKSFFLPLIICFVLFINSTLTGSDEVPGFANIQERLRTRIEASGIPPRLNVGSELIYASVALPLFYERRAYNLAWSDTGGPLPVADLLVGEIEKADINGLNPGSYHLSTIKTTLDQVRNNQARHIKLNPGRLVSLDLLLTDAYLIYGSHLLSGRIDPITIDPEWFTDLRQMDMAQVLENALNGSRLAESLGDLLPPQPGYRKLANALARYREIESGGGWQPVPEGVKMQKGDRNERIIPLRRRLAITGDLESMAGDTNAVFDEELEKAVAKFQYRHGLDTDGVVGKRTIAALNIEVKDRINMLILNLERWRWLPQDMGTKHILVNIANFELDMIESDSIIFNMKVVVGRPYRRTPVFSDKMTYLVFNPYWSVPTNIAVADILPQVIKDPGYLARQNLKVIAGWGVNMEMVDPATVDWQSIDTKNFPYWFRQDPGPLNALGKVKFMFPNQFNVYLHDTPARELFAKNSRDFSSGCIRIEKPVELAQYVLKNDTTWTYESISRAINTGIEKTVRLPEPLPIHILYWTAWVDNDGRVNFRNDLYNRDAPLLAALLEEPPKLN